MQAGPVDCRVAVLLAVTSSVVLLEVTSSVVLLEVTSSVSVIASPRVSVIASP